jgi:DNA-binding winged helix-turn-helix (wHTH) protein
METYTSGGESSSAQGRLVLDEAARELLHDGCRIRLQEQPYQVLRMLLARPGDVVSRDALRARLWPDGTFVDFEHSLNAAIKRLRAVLGDDAKSPRFIETLPRIGYRWIATRMPRQTFRNTRIEVVWA